MFSIPVLSLVSGGLLLVSWMGVRVLSSPVAGHSYESKFVGSSLFLWGSFATGEFLARNSKVRELGGHGPLASGPSVTLGGMEWSN